ncbi:unnamed protein product, partial [Allacma fusca]
TAIPTLKNNNSHSNQNLLQEITKEQLYGLGTKFFWRNLTEIAAQNKIGPGTAIQESSPILRKGLKSRNELRKTDGRKPLENLVNNSDVVAPSTCDSNESKAITQYLPNGPRSRMQYLITSIPNASWSTV